MANTLDITPYFNISILEESPNWPIYLLVQAAKRRISRAFSNVQWQKSEVDY